MVFAIIFALFASYGVVLNTTKLISDKIVLRIALAKLTFTPLNVKVSVSLSSETFSIRGFILLYNTSYLIYFIINFFVKQSIKQSNN